MRKFFLLSLFLVFVCTVVHAQSQWIYLWFNPSDPCTGSSSTIFYQLNPGFTQGTFKCVAGVYVAVDLSTVGSGIGGSGTANKIPKFTAATTLGNSNVTDTGSLITFGSNAAINGSFTFLSSDQIIPSGGVLNVTDSLGAFRDTKVRNLLVDITSSGDLANAPCYLNGLAKLTCNPVLTNGQLLIGKTGDVPQAGNVTGTSPIVITNGAGTIDVSCPTCGTAPIAQLLLFEGQSGTDSIANNTTSFTYPHNYLSTGSLWNGTESTRGFVMPYNGTVDKLVVKTDTAQPGTNTLTVTVRKNGADTAITLTIAAGSAAGIFSDTTHSFTVSQGDRIAIKGVNSAGGSASAVFLLLSLRYTVSTIP